MVVGEGGGRLFGEKHAILSISLFFFPGGIGTEGVEEVLAQYLGEEVPDLVRLALTFPGPFFSHTFKPSSKPKIHLCDMKASATKLMGNW
jgi:hypothetical protein